MEKEKRIKEESKEEFQEPKTIKRKKEIDILDLPGVGAATAEKLKSFGFTTLMSIAVASPGQLMEVSGLTESAARKTIHFARNAMDMGFESGSDLLARRATVQKINVGSNSFNELMGGGFESGVITECFGEYGSGKTQIAHLLAVNVQKQIPNAEAVYIDTENTFRPERIIQLAEGAGLNPEKVLKNVKVARAYNSDHQLLLAEKVEDMLKEKEGNIKVMIIRIYADCMNPYFLSK